MEYNIQWINDLQKRQAKLLAFDQTWHQILAVPMGKEKIVMQHKPAFDSAVGRNTKDGAVDWQRVAADFQSYVDGMLVKSRKPRTGSFTIRLTPEKYHFTNTVMADMPGMFFVACESEPNVEIGDEVGVIVGDTKETGTVERIQPRKSKLSEAEQKRQELGQQMAAMQFQMETGVDPAMLPKDPNVEEQWYLLLRRKA
jgi:hypothetical protein